MKKFLSGFVLAALMLSIPMAFAMGTMFSDVKEGDYFYGAVKSLSEKGIVNGYGDNTFRPGQEINRAEVAVMIDRAMRYMDGEKVEIKEEVNEDYYDRCNQHLGAYSTLDWFVSLEDAAIARGLDLKLIADLCFFEEEGMFVFILPDRNDPDFPPVYSFDLETGVLAKTPVKADSFVGGFEFFGRDGAKVYFEGGYGEGGVEMDEDGNEVGYSCKVSVKYVYDAKMNEISVKEDNSGCDSVEL